MTCSICHGAKKVQITDRNGGPGKDMKCPACMRFKAAESNRGVVNKWPHGDIQAWKASVVELLGDPEL